MKNLPPHIPSTTWKGVDESNCRRLLVAVLERAILDLCGSRSHSGKAHKWVNPSLQEHVLNWIYDTRHEDQVNSYSKICSLIGIDKDLLRDEKIRERVIRYYRTTDTERKENG